MFRRFFEKIVELCQQAGLVWGKELYFDGTKVQANASVDSLKPRFYVDAHLHNLFGAASSSAETERVREMALQKMLLLVADPIFVPCR